jgi:hypothetical protein
MLAGSTVKGVIATALQGYRSAAPGPVQGPPSPVFAPGRQGSLPFQATRVAADLPPMGTYDPDAEAAQLIEEQQQRGANEWEAPGVNPIPAWEPQGSLPPTSPFRGDQDLAPAIPNDFYSRSTDQRASLLDFLQSSGIRALAKGGRVDKDEPVVVGEEGPEFFVPDEPGTVFPHMPQPGKGDPKIGRWPKAPAPDYPGRYRGLEGAIKQQTAVAQNPMPGLMEMIDSERMRLNEANWRRMLSDPDLIARGQLRMEDRRQPSDYGAWDIPAVDRTPNEMSRQLGYDAIRRPSPRVVIGNRRY